MRLEIGCGGVPTIAERMIHLDLRPLPHVEYVCDAVSTPFKDNEIEDIMAVNILEHIPRKDTLKALCEWYRILKPGGTCLIGVPNIVSYFKRYLEERLTFEELCEGVYGSQDYEENFHKAGFVPS